VTGGTAQTITPAPTVSLINDPTTPPQIYQTDRNGTFTYTFNNLTPGANYRVRLHLSDPTNNAPGKRIFNVTVNGTSEPNIDIVGQTQSAPAQVDGLVSDSTGTTLIAATLTVTDTSGNAVTTTPAPLTSTNSTKPDPAGGAPINYLGSLPQGTYTVTATPNNSTGIITALIIWGLCVSAYAGGAVQIIAEHSGGKLNLLPTDILRVAKVHVGKPQEQTPPRFHPPVRIASSAYPNFNPSRTASVLVGHLR